MIYKCASPNYLFIIKYITGFKFLIVRLFLGFNVNPDIFSGRIFTQMTDKFSSKKKSKNGGFMKKSFDKSKKLQSFSTLKGSQLQRRVKDRFFE